MYLQVGRLKDYFYLVIANLNFYASLLLEKMQLDSSQSIDKEDNALQHEKFVGV